MALLSVGEFYLRGALGKLHASDLKLLKFHKDGKNYKVRVNPL
jgi:hypothetical protein